MKCPNCEFEAENKKLFLEHLSLEQSIDDIVNTKLCVDLEKRVGKNEM